MNYGENTKIMWKHNFMITKKIYILMCFQIFPLCITLFLMKAIFIQGAFKNNEGFLRKIEGLSGYPTNFQFSRTFQGGGAKPRYPLPPPLPPPKKVCLWHILFALPTTNGPFPAELKLRKNTGVVENFKHLTTGVSREIVNSVFKGNKINCFPRDQSLSDLQSWKFWSCRSIKPRHDLLSVYQSGFQKKHSTETAIVYLTDYILEHMDRQQ